MKKMIFIFVLLVCTCVYGKSVERGVIPDDRCSHDAVLRYWSVKDGNTGLITVVVDDAVSHRFEDGFLVIERIGPCGTENYRYNLDNTFVVWVNPALPVF